MAELTIAACGAADLDAVAALVNAAYRSEGGWTNEVGVVDGQRIDLETLQADLAQPQTVILLLREGDALLACVRLDQGPVAYIGMLAVQPALQARGLGRRLLDHVEGLARAQGAVTARITVVSIRDSLIAWYERHGYGRTGELEVFHADGRFGQPRRDLAMAALEKPLV